MEITTDNTTVGNLPCNRMMQNASTSCQKHSQTSSPTARQTPDPWQSVQMAYFKKCYPSVQQLLKAFAPQSCKYVIEHEDCIPGWPQVLLSQVDEAYHAEGLAEYFAKLLFTTIYAQGNTGMTCKEEFVKMNAGLFLAQYGGRCTMFDYLLYMGTYRTKYKPDYVSNNDTSDIIKRFPEYLKHKGELFATSPYGKKLRQAVDAQAQTDGSNLVGYEALEFDMKRRARAGEDIRKSNLVPLYISRERVQEIMDEYSPKPF